MNNIHKHLLKKRVASIKSRLWPYDLFVDQERPTDDCQMIYDAMMPMENLVVQVSSEAAIERLEVTTFYAKPIA